MNYEKSCGCVILNDKNEVILALHNAGHWGLPKGHMEDGETEEQTAIREVKEETNIDVIVDTSYRYSMTYSPKEGVIKEVIFFLARNATNDIKPQLEEMQTVKWFTYEDAIKNITYENSKEILIKLKKDMEDRKKC